MRLAVIGGGHLGRIHAKLAHANDSFEVVAVADPSEASRSIVTEQLGLPTVADYTELLDKVDAAVVAAPTELHYEITSTLLRAGIHCLVEKPLAASADQAERLVQIANRHHRVLQVGHVERFNPVWTAAQQELQHPKFIEAVRSGPYSGRSTDIGVVMDLMVHDLDLILSLDKSDVVEVRASGVAVVGTHEDIAEARIEFASGCIANIKASRVASEATRSMQVYCEDCYANINFSSDEVQLVKPTADILSRAIALDLLPAKERMEAKDRIYQDLLKPATLAAPKRNAILDEQTDFAVSIESSSSPSVSGADGARAVHVARLIVEAIEKHAWDGVSSQPWRIGALATQEPRILTMPTRTVAETDTVRKAG